MSRVTSKRRCTNRGCSLHSITVSTSRRSCLGCGEQLAELSASQDVLSDLFGTQWFS